MSNTVERKRSARWPHVLVIAVGGAIGLMEVLMSCESYRPAEMLAVEDATKPWANNDAPNIKIVEMGDGVVCYFVRYSQGIALSCIR